MHMVCHQAIGMDTVPIPLQPLLEQKQKAAPIPWIKENVQPGVATQDDMVAGTGIMDSWFACHSI